MFCRGCLGINQQKQGWNIDAILCYIKIFIKMIESTGNHVLEREMRRTKTEHFTHRAEKKTWPPQAKSQDPSHPHRDSETRCCQQPLASSAISSTARVDLSSWTVETPRAWTGRVEGTEDQHPPVMTNIAMENPHRNSRCSHSKWWFSTALLNSQREENLRSRQIFWEHWTTEEI